MKNLFLFAAVLLCSVCGVRLFAEEVVPLFNWSLLWSGSWEENKTLHNRGEAKLHFLPLGLVLRGQVLDRRTLNFELDDPWGDPEKAVTNYMGGLYHRTTGSRLLYGVLDEWGLSARIRNPWIRSPPYAENHMPLIADLKTAASSTKQDEAYLYLSSPVLELFPNLKLRGFLSAQTEVEKLTPAFSGGFDFMFANNTSLLLEMFYTDAMLPPTKAGSWFANPPPLPEREFHLYAAGLLFTHPDFSVSTDWALSETFAWGTDIYGNFGVSMTPLLPFGNRARPLTISFAVDGAGGRFVYRDGANHGAGFRGAAKIEWKDRYNSLFRINTVLRGPGLGEETNGAFFNRSSTGIYYRFPSKSNSNFPVRLTRVSLTADRNAVNLKKVSDGLSGYIGLSVNLANHPLGINLSGSVDGLAVLEGSPSPYPVHEESRVFDTGSVGCEFVLPLGIFQFRSKTGCTFYAEKGEKWDFSLSASARFRYGRLSLKAAMTDSGEKWSWTVSWRLERQEKKVNL